MSVVFIGLYWKRVEEPMYRGRYLSDYMSSASLVPGSPEARVRSQAFEAVGTNALAFLRHELRLRESTLGQRASAFLVRRLGFPPPEKSIGHRHMESVLMAGMLEKKAIPLLPDLIALREECDTIPDDSIDVVVSVLSSEKQEPGATTTD